MYKFACKCDDKIVCYFDTLGNKYTASGGNLAWRIRNPGLLRSRSLAKARNKPIGCYDGLAIFAEPEQGFEALSDWLRSKKRQSSSLVTIAKYYNPSNLDLFTTSLTEIVGVPHTQKVGALSKQEFEKLLIAISKCCSYQAIGDENFSLLPKISAKIENGKDSNQDTYLIGADTILSKAEAIKQVLSHQLDAVVVHDHAGNMHLRSRPLHCIQHFHLKKEAAFPFKDQIEVLARSIGEKKPNQCVWGYINGIANTKDEALESAMKISTAAQGDLILSMPNDQILWGIGNFVGCLVLKFSIDTPIVDLAVKFFRHLLKSASVDSIHPPIIVFAHSQGAIIAEHALEHLEPKERNKLRIFTFGGGSFITPEKCHPDSHNYVSASDIIPSTGSPNLQNIALELYYGNKKRISQDQVINKLVMRDARLFCSFLRNPHGRNWKITLHSKLPITSVYLKKLAM
jgi:hypothetical protein